MVQRRKFLLGAVGAAGLAACTRSPSRSSSVWEQPTAAPIRLTAPTGRISPAGPAVLTVDGGRIESVTGLAGTVDADGTTWRSAGSLAYDKKYKVTARLLDSLGATVEKTAAFTTVKPRALAGVTFQANGLAALETGGTYGVGQPVIVAFSKAVKDRAAAEKAITVETSPPVDGKFFWVDNTIVHWRPAKYWAKGTTVKVSVNTVGVNLGNGLYGKANATTHFTIGRSLIAVSDNKTHRTRVYIDGKLARDMACSNGQGGYTKIANGEQIHFWTQSGPHVVLSKERTHSMSSASYGLSDPHNPFYYEPEDVQFCTRISYSGEFLHAAPWNTQLGQANTSHGCINLSTADAQWVYKNFLIGDVVEVVHSPKPLPTWDGLGDWTVPYTKYGT
ncbi:Ig-like domain-containing protein [Actinoplanes sp. NPDC048988]|uniref:L,D-transpeptidase n=1 Tax=Actinoplanes sp. NPDC048988 TaxID=3363901 RepID=UPI00371CAC0B